MHPESNTSSFSIHANWVDIQQKKIVEAKLFVADQKIDRIEVLANTPNDDLEFLMPGFTDSHVHIESSMLIPSEFARLAVVHGTVSTISDPHEIANVCGVEGVLFMIENGQKVPFKFNFGAPSCVPATNFETAGAEVNVEEVAELLSRPDIRYLSEMMNFPGVLFNDPTVMNKILAAKKLGKPIDGHAPGLRGDDVVKYIAAGISTDHECFTKEEALEKLQHGMKILIREGSAAKNFEALIELLHDYPNDIMFCSDDKHPDSLVEGHINQLCARAIAKGIPLFHVLQAACINPVLHYKTEVGLLQPGAAADFILVKNLESFEVSKTYINGQLVAANGKSFIESVSSEDINRFSCNEITEADLKVELDSYPSEDSFIPVIEALDGQLITNKLLVTGKLHHIEWVSDVEHDILKIVVVNRYKSAPVAKAFVKGFGLKEGAIASSVAHDSHNIVAVGTDDHSLMRAVNLVIAAEGGVSCVGGQHEHILPLPVAGLMSAKDGYKVAEAYTNIDEAAKLLGSNLAAPFMTLSFMALLVIPHLKLSDQGLFDGDNFCFV
ncbi:MAG: adenine deaminase [Hydrotalea sp.]|nr:adenine deaminase [Hydrotalea sp.]